MTEKIERDNKVITSFTFPAQYSRILERWEVTAKRIVVTHTADSRLLNKTL